MIAGSRRPAVRWALAGVIAGVALTLLAVTALPFIDRDKADERVAEVSVPVVSLLWQVPTGRPVTGPPSVTAGGVLLGGVDGKIRAYALADGSAEWTFHAASGKPVYTRAGGGVVYAATGGGEVFAVDVRTGKQRWRAEAETTFSEPPAVGEDRVYLSGNDGALHAYRINDGKRHWRLRTGGELRTRPTVVGEFAVVASDDGKLYMASSAGSLLRTRVVGLVTGGPVSTGDAACVPLADGSVRCVRADDGQNLATVALRGAKLSDPAKGDGVVLAAGADGAVGAWDKDTGAQKWVFRPARPASAAGRLVLGAGRVVAAYPDGRLIGIDAGTGKEQWEHTLPDNIDEGARLGKGAVYVVGRSGTLYALRVPAALTEPGDSGD